MSDKKKQTVTKTLLITFDLDKPDVEDFVKRFNEHGRVNEIIQLITDHEIDVVEIQIK